MAGLGGHVLPPRLGVSCGAVRAVAQQEGAARPSSPVPGAHSRAEAALTGPQGRRAETGGVGQALRGRCRGKVLAAREKTLTGSDTRPESSSEKSESGRL